MTQSPNIVDAVRSAWPGGIGDEDRALLRRLSIDEELLVAFRLSALLEVEAGRRPASRAPVGDPRGITDSGFQSLVRRWRGDRSIRTLLPYADRATRGRGDTPDHRAVVAAVDALLKDRPDLGLTALTRDATRSIGTGLAFNSVKLIARERRALRRRDATRLAGSYGEAMLADVCALGAEIAIAPGITTTAVVALVVEHASGIVLGHAVGDWSSALDLQRAAIADGLVAVIEQRLDVPVGKAVLDVVVAPGDDDDVRRYADALRAGSFDGRVVDTPRRRYGDRVADLLDGSMGGLKLRPRGGRPTRRAAAQAWEAARLAEVAREAVSVHNAERIAVLRTALPSGGLTSRGGMLSTLTRAVEAG